MSNLNITKTSSASNIAVGGIITYSLNISNNGTANLTKVTIYDILDAKLEFIEGSVTLNNNQIEGNISSGILIGDVKVGASNTITFKAKTLSTGTIGNTAKGTFYYLDSTGKEQYGTVNSNLINVVSELISVNLTKTANKSSANLGETVDYTITVKNNGNIDVNNVTVKDMIDSNLTVVEGTVKLNGVAINSVDLSKGINIGTVKKGESSSISYSAMVTGTNCNGKITNTATATYTYILADGTVGKGASEPTGSEVSTIEVGINNFKQISIEETLVIPTVKPDIEEITEITGEIEIVKSHIIKTPVANSNEGQNLTGHKLLIYGKINEVIEYTALDVEQSVHSAHYSIPFTTFIVLPANFCVGNRIEVKGYAEHIYFNQLNEREAFSNATVLIKATLCNSCK